MGINVELRDASGQVLAEVLDHKLALARAARGNLSGTRLLRYLVPYGDTVFNQAQANDLRDDLHEISRTVTGSPLAEVAVRLDPLVDRLAGEVHVYLWFVGD